MRSSRISPPTRLFPEDVINGLRALNGGRQHAEFRLSDAAGRAMARHSSSE